MKTVNIITLDYRQVPLKIVFKGINGEKRDYKIMPSANKCGISMNKDE